LDPDAPHRAFSRKISPGASSVRNLSKAFAVLLFTVPRGTPVRSDISLVEARKIGRLYQVFVF
jgi:hypothetical protein